MSLFDAASPSGVSSTTPASSTDKNSWAKALSSPTSAIAGSGTGSPGLPASSVGQAPAPTPAGGVGDTTTIAAPPAPVMNTSAVDRPLGVESTTSGPNNVPLWHSAPDAAPDQPQSPTNSSLYGNGKAGFPGFGQGNTLGQGGGDAQLKQLLQALLNGGQQ